MRLKPSAEAPIVKIYWEYRAMLAQWNESFVLGIPAIDKQHRELYQMMEDLKAAKADRREKGVVRDTLERILPFLREHFAEEERAVGVNSPEYPNCMLKHDQELEMVKFFLRGKTADDPSAADDLLYFLDSMLEGHIEWDRKSLGITGSSSIQ